MNHTMGDTAEHGFGHAASSATAEDDQIGLGGFGCFKDDVREVAAGYECGLSLEGFQDVKQGDVIEAFERVPVVRRISAPASGREAPRVSGV